jgi:TolB protein
VRRIAVAVAALVLFAGVAGQALATFPGRNGRLAFRRYFNPQHTAGALFTAKPSGSDVRQITHPPKGVLDTEPDWSPDGTQIVFYRDDPNGCGEGCEASNIYTVNADGSELTRVTDCSTAATQKGACLFAADPAWSPDGSHIVFAEDVAPFANDTPFWTGLVTIRADGTHLRRVTRGQTHPVSFFDHGPQWSPDGRWLVFQRDSFARNHWAVFISQSDGSHARRLTPWSMDAGDHPDWSPDGQEILFRSHVDEDVQSNIYTIHADGTDLDQLTHYHDLKLNPLSSSFSPSGKRITFSRFPATGGENADVFTMNLHGAHLHNVTRSTIWDSATDWGSR